MKLRNLIVVLALATSMTAVADIVTKVESVEVSTAELNVPVSSNGRLSFKRCANDCDYESARLTPETRFVVQGEDVLFIDFRKAFFNRRGGEPGYSLVSFDVERNVVTRVIVQY